jgi:hypothetical protein
VWRARGALVRCCAVLSHIALHANAVASGPFAAVRPQAQCSCAACGRRSHSRRQRRHNRNCQ